MVRYGVRWRCVGWFLGVFFLVFAPSAGAQPAVVRQPGEETILRALAADPITAPYAFWTTVQNGKVVLSGRVGSKAIYDAAIRDVIATGVPFLDRLVIDTAEIGRSVGPGSAGPGIPYVYPQPLFGYYDDPFYGFEPPVISYPPWWGAISQNRLASSLPPAPATEVPRALPPYWVEMTIDPLGYAVLRGTVSSDEIRQGLAQKAAGLPGVNGIINHLDVKPDIGPPPPPPTEAAPRTVSPPPPPAPEPPPTSQPAPSAPPAAAPAPAPSAPPTLEARLTENVRRSPALSGVPVRIHESNGTAVVEGRAPSVLEAMLTFRTVQQTPGVREVVDRLQFPVPEPGRPNPLIEQGRPDDVEPYLEAQLRRQLGDEAHVDRVRVHGNVLEIRGTVASATAQPRMEAILRTLPILRGYRVDATFVPE